MATITFTITAVLSILLGILVLVFPKLLRWAIGLYLIAVGVLNLLGNYLQLSPGF